MGIEGGRSPLPADVSLVEHDVSVTQGAVGEALLGIVVDYLEAEQVTLEPNGRLTVGHDQLGIREGSARIGARLTESSPEPSVLPLIPRQLVPTRAVIRGQPELA